MSKPVYEIPLGDNDAWPTSAAPPAPAQGDMFQRARVSESSGSVHDLSGGAPLPAESYEPAPPSFAALVDSAGATPAFPLPVAAPSESSSFSAAYTSAPPPVAPQQQAAPAFAAISAPQAAAPMFPPPALAAPQQPAPATAPLAPRSFSTTAPTPPPALAPPAPAMAPPALPTPSLSTAPLFPPVAEGEPTRRSRSLENRPPAHAEVPVEAPAPEAKVTHATPAADDLSPQVGDGQEGSDPDIVAALNAVVTAKASDLHITAKSTPMVRIDGSLKPVPGTEVWDADKLEQVLRSIMSEAQQKQFEEVLELDFAYTLSTTARFRVNVYRQRNAFGAAFRLIPTEIKTLASLGVPATVGEFAKLARGLVLVTGPTGSGKSTTLAALIDLVNSTRADHIVTVEDPIEFMHQNKKSLVNQREVGHDTHSFTAALKHVLRQDPDVILIGELRDLETISVALTAAETGHLVFATLHTQDAAQTIDRVIDVFPPHQQGQVRAQLAATLQGVVCQTLVKNASGKGRVVATEVLVSTPAISNLIREGKTYQIHSSLQAGRELGMFTMDQHLAELVDNGRITHAAAAEKAHDIEGLKQMIHRADPSAGAFTGPATGNIELSGMYNMGGN